MIKPKKNPTFYGSKVCKISSNELFQLLSEKVLFEARWGFSKGNLSEADYKHILDSKAKPALADFIHNEVANPIIDAKAVYGYYKCRRQGDSIEILSESDTKIVLSFPRQKKEPFCCLSDFVNDREEDFLALFALSLGERFIKAEKELFEKNSYYEYHLLHGLGAELADCAAVYLHRLIHVELFTELLLGNNKPRGCRYSFGYPACPDLSYQKYLFNLLKPERIGLSLTESYQMVPELAVSGLIIFDKKARYFVP